ncbi:hypothetical protein Cadr_000005376 [Camelus dromedarius]|uniref:Uncharacterized protein n=1 Tax=Camelus dromedarius TaxID=9838 RepID=A0A5N4E378_CAMDR|nr:hypothetical protein Cadr_000005376 [Camelus dromedarius]
MEMLKLGFKLCSVAKSVLVFTVSAQNALGVHTKQCFPSPSGRVFWGVSCAGAECIDSETGFTGPHLISLCLELS